MVQIKVAVCGALLAGLALAGALAHPVPDHDVVELGRREINPDKLDRMRSRLGLQPVQQEKYEPEVEVEKPKPRPKAAPAPPKDTVDRKSSSPEPKRITNSSRNPPQQAPRHKPQEQPPRQKPQQKAKPQEQAPRKKPKPANNYQGDKPRKPSREPASEPEDDEGANQQSRPRGKGADNSQRGGNGGGAPPGQSRSGPGAAPATKNAQPKQQYKDGPSRFQNKKANKLAKTDNASGIEELQDAAPREFPVPKKTPQTSPDITQGGPRDRSDGSRARKQGRKPPSEQGDIDGPEQTAKKAVESAGAPENVGSSKGRKQNKPQNTRHATTKRVDPHTKSGATADTASEVTDEKMEEPESKDNDHSYFEWYRSNDKRPVDFAARTKDGWKKKYAVPEEEAKEVPPPPPQGLDKLPINQRQREKDAQEAKLKEQNRKADRRAGF